MKNDIETTEVTPGHFESSPFPMRFGDTKKTIRVDL
jgi:hypothetical protein